MAEDVEAEEADEGFDEPEDLTIASVADFIPHRPTCSASESPALRSAAFLKEDDATSPHQRSPRPLLQLPPDPELEAIATERHSSLTIQPTRRRLTFQSHGATATATAPSVVIAEDTQSTQSIETSSPTIEMEDSSRSLSSPSPSAADGVSYSCVVKSSFDILTKDSLLPELRC